MNARIVTIAKDAPGGIMKQKTLHQLIKLTLNEPAPEVVAMAGDFYSPYYSLFYYISQYLKTGICLELGVETGRGCKALAMGSDGATVYGLDTNNIVTHNGFKFYQKPSLPPPSEVLGQPFDFLHIDTEHSYAMAQAEFEAYQPYLKPGAVVAFDDLHAMENDVWRYFINLPYYKVQEDRLHPICGYGLIIYGE